MLWFPSGTRAVLRKLYEAGAIQIDTSPGGGFRLKEHDKNPDLPLSPIKVSLRIPANGGNLDDALVGDIAALMHRTIPWRTRRSAAYVAGVPNAGDPFAEKLALKLGLKRIPLKKRVFGDGTRAVSELILPKGCIVGGRVLLFDDLITRAGSKMEAVDLFRGAGFTIEDVFVFCDREQGGKEELARHGVRLHAYITLRQMMRFYLSEKLISLNDYWTIMEYLAK